MNAPPAALEDAAPGAGAATARPAAETDVRTMQCMEVWGGNAATDSAFSLPGLDVHLFSQPAAAAAAGGDVHYLSSCATGRITRLLVADVSGHGEEVAEFAHALRQLMRRYVNFMSQTAFVRKMNRHFSRVSDGGMFATAIVATYWAPTSWLVICNAGHPRALHYSARRGSWSSVMPGAPSPGLTNLPLGVVEAVDYDQVGLTLEKDDLVLLHTDSLTESRDGSGRMLGEAGLLDLLNELGAPEPRRLISVLCERTLAGGGASDDLTMLVLRPGASAGGTLSLRTLPGFIARWAVAARDALAGRGPFPWPELGLASVLGTFWARMNRRIGRGG